MGGGVRGLLERPRRGAHGRSKGRGATERAPLQIAIEFHDRFLAASSPQSSIHGGQQNSNESSVSASQDAPLRPSSAAAILQRARRDATWRTAYASDAWRRAQSRKPVAVHNNWIKGHEAKLERFKRWGLWHGDLNRTLR